MKVLLVDADLRKPALHTSSLSRDNGQGLSNCLTGNTVPPELFQNTDFKGLTFLATGPLPPNPAELIASAKMLSLLTVAAESFDLVIIDGPPVSGLADAPLLASLVDGTLLVIDPATARRGMVKGALKRLAFARAQMVGIAVNKIDMTHAGYGYGYGYGNGYGYGYGDRYYGGEDAAKLAKPQSGEGADFVRTPDRKVGWGGPGRRAAPAAIALAGSPLLATAMQAAAAPGRRALADPDRGGP